MENVPIYCRLTETPSIQGDPFAIARATCRRAALSSEHVAIDETDLRRFTQSLDTEAVRSVTNGHMGENCDVGAEDFSNAREAVNFVLLFSLLQFGHGFRYELHDLCGRGASRTITHGLRNLRQGGFAAGRLKSVNIVEVRELFGLPRHDALNELTLQLWAVLRQAGEVLDDSGAEDFDSFCRSVLSTDKTGHPSAAALGRSLANAFPAFNDQGRISDGTWVVLVKKISLAVGELSRVVTPHDTTFARLSDEVVAPVDNVIPAVLVFNKVLRLSDELYSKIHERREPLPRGPQECELRAVALEACERIVEVSGHEFSALSLGYYLWLSGKEPATRRFCRHHTKDTVYY